jgi:hypothetical protein
MCEAAEQLSDAHLAADEERMAFVEAARLGTTGRPAKAVALLPRCYPGARKAATPPR